jgi:bla regulator protein blaR1
MHVLVGIALKSLLIAGITLGLIALMKRRSAAERSWVAHIGLLALVIMAFAPLVLPSWSVEAPAMFGQESSAQASVQTPAPTPTNVSAPIAANSVKVASPTLVSPAAVATAVYAVPAAILLFITLLALGRLIALRARADVLVDGHWLSALARAQRRMGFKHGTALLTSNELPSPISWGLMRPVILLNNRAVEASDEAEAIIAHELAHVARMDWAKLLLTRIATALFWFNPLVWILAREAHQLREEAADDAVLAADIVDTDYAQLLVGVARHECPGLLLGAHGVAPSKSSLARRVARVLDGNLVRGPAARSFALGVFVGAVLIAAPLAALTFTPANTQKKAAVGSTNRSVDSSKPYYSATDVPTDLGSIIADGVSTAVSASGNIITTRGDQTILRANDGSSVAISSLRSGDNTIATRNGETVLRASDGRTVTISAPGPDGRRRMVAKGPSGTAVAYLAPGEMPPGVPPTRAQQPRSAIDRMVDAKAVGITPEYIGAMRAIPRLGNLDLDELTDLRAVGVTPEFARDLVASFPSITADEIVEARAVGLSGGYVRAMRAAGLQGDLDDFIQLRAVGVDPSFAARVQKSGVRVRNVDDLIELHALGAVKPPAPPKPPRPPSGRDPDSDPDG